MRFILTILSLPLFLWAAAHYDLELLEIGWLGWGCVFLLYVWAVLWALDAQVNKARPGDYSTGGAGGYGSDGGWGGGIGGGGCDGGGGGGDGGC